MNIPYLSIDDSFKSINKEEVTADIIDTYIQMTSMNLIDLEKRFEHVLELVTNKFNYWENLIDCADELIWVKSEGHGWALYAQNEACGYIRLYRIKPTRDHDHFREKPWNRGNWRVINSNRELKDIIDTQEAKYIFSLWKNNQIKVNSLPTTLANGRLENTNVERVLILSKGNGCVICGDYSTHRAATTFGGEATQMISLSLCKNHQYEATKHPCVLSFFGALFFLKMDIPDLLRLDHIPDEMIEPIVSIVASYIDAEYSKPTLVENGWKVKLSMSDGWYWILRLKALNNYAYMLFNSNNVQVHRIDSAADHPEVPFGPDHQHSMPNRKNHSIEPSFTYGIPLFDFPLLVKSKEIYSEVRN